MNNEKLLRRAEKDIRLGIKSIRDGKKTPQEAGLAKILNAMINLDEPLYEELMIMYKAALQSPLRRR